MESGRTSFAEGEARLHQRIADTSERVIAAVHAVGVERAVESIRVPKARGSSGGAGT